MPIEPIRTKEAFASQCGVLVRDKIPISIQQWLKPAKEDPEVSYVSDMQKEDLWTALKAKFTLPLVTHKYRGSIVVLSISKSVEPNKEQKEMISGFQQVLK